MRRIERIRHSQRTVRAPSASARRGRGGLSRGGPDRSSPDPPRATTTSTCGPNRRNNPWDPSDPGQRLGSDADPLVEQALELALAHPEGLREARHPDGTRRIGNRAHGVDASGASAGTRRDARQHLIEQTHARRGIRSRALTCSPRSTARDPQSSRRGSEASRRRRAGTPSSSAKASPGRNLTPKSETCADAKVAMSAFVIVPTTAGTSAPLTSKRGNPCCRRARCAAARGRWPRGSSNRRRAVAVAERAGTRGRATTPSWPQCAMGAGSVDSRSTRNVITGSRQNGTARPVRPILCASRGRARPYRRRRLPSSPGIAASRRGPAVSRRRRRRRAWIATGWCSLATSRTWRTTT